MHDMILAVQNINMHACVILFQCVIIKGVLYPLSVSQFLDEEM